MTFPLSLSSCDAKGAVSLYEAEAIYCHGGEAVEIRLLDLDAPEGCQVFGAESKRALRERLLNQPVRVQTGGLDDYQRQLARITHKGEDVGAWMVRTFAWSSSTTRWTWRRRAARRYARACGCGPSATSCTRCRRT